MGCVSLVNYDERYAFLGLFIVVPELRGRGIGSVLFKAALARAGARVTGLDGVVDQQPYYARMGFELLHRNMRWLGTGSGGRSADVVDLVEAPLEYDRAVFGADRAAWLERWIQPAHRALAIPGRGYGVARRNNMGWKIGPLYADDADTAQALLDALVPAGERFVIDVPEANAAAASIVRGCEPVFETARMERGGRSDTDWGRVFGIGTLELG